MIDHGNMLIISNEAFMSTMNPLIEWKTLKGIPVEMVSITDAGGNASAIKNYVSKKVKVIGGIDIYLTSNKFLRSLGKKLKKSFNG